MKFVALAFALLLIGAIAHADVIAPNTHAVDRCVMITNLGSYPDIYLIAETTAPGATGKTISMYAINQGECLTKGYKFNGFNVYWTTKSYIDSVGGAQSADGNSANMHLITRDINPYGGYVPDSNPKTNETLEYRLECQPYADKCMNPAGCGAPHIVSCNLTLASQGNELPPAPPDDNSTKPLHDIAIAENPFQVFWCWLMGIFGQKC